MTREEAIKAIKAWDFLDKDEKEAIETLIPELKESEDERIRKDFCKDIWTYIPNEKAHKYIAWLEKQGAQKVSVVDFKAKDWYVSKVDGKIHNIYTTMEEKQKWSEEDSLMIDSIIDTMKWLEGKGATNMKIDWLKSLKQRMEE